MECSRVIMNQEIAASMAEVETVVRDDALNLLLNNTDVNQQEHGIEPVTREKMNVHFDRNVTGRLNYFYAQVTGHVYN